MSKETETWITFERSAILFMAFVCAISLLAITGWLFNLPVLASFRPEFIPMAPSTALIFLGLGGVGLLYRVCSARRGMRFIVQAGLLGMLVIVLMIAIRTFTGLGPDLEQLLYPNPPLAGQISLPRSSPLTALGFSLAIPAFLLLTRRELRQRAKSASAALSLAVFTFSGLIVLSYLYGVPPFYGGTFIPMSVPTALSFLFLSLSLLMTAGPTCWPVRMYVGDSLKARLMRSIIPASIVIVLLQGLLSTAGDPWIINPAFKVAFAALVACLIFMLIISLIAQNLSTEIESGNQARNTAESILKQSEARFRTLVETVNAAIINIDREGHIVFWNRAAETIFGYSAGEMIGKSLAELMPEEFYAAHLQGLQRVVLTGDSHIIGKTVEITGLRKDGREFPLALSLATWQVDGDVFFTGVGRDISERKQSETALAEERNLLVTLMDNLPDMIYFKDVQSHIIRSNLAHARRVGLNDPAEMIGKTDFDLFGEEHAQGAFEDEQAILRTGQPLVNKEEEENFLDGHTLWVSTTKMPWRNQQSQIVGTFGISRDITERKQSEEALQKSAASLQAVLHSTADGILAVGKENEVLYANDRFAEIWRIPQAVMDSKDDSIMIQHVLDQLSDPQSFLKEVQALYKSSKESFDTLHFKDGRVFERLSRPLMQGEVVSGRVWSFRDVTARKQNEKLQDAIYRISQASDNADSLDSLYSSIHTIIQEVMVADNFYIALYDEKNDLLSFPYSVDEQDLRSSTKKPGKGLTEYILRTGRTVLCDETLYQELTQRDEIELVGTRAPIWLGVPLTVGGKVIGAMVVQDYKNARTYDQREKRILEFVSTQVARAIDRKHLEEEIRSLSLTDELTGLYNRRGFTLLAERELKLAHRMKRAMLLFFGDVDNFKSINDTWGHAQGDLALKEISAILKKNFRESDIIARIGGDEFVVLAVDGSRESAEIMANRIQAALDACNRQGDNSYQLSLSLGVARYDPEAPGTMSELIAQADGLMYQQKQARKGIK